MKAFLLLGALFGATFAHAQSGGGFQLISFTVDGGGGPQAGGAFSLTGTIGQPDGATSADTECSLQGGFWPSDWAVSPSPVGLKLHIALTSGGRIELSAQATPGVTAVVESSGDLGDPNGWSNLGAVTADSSGLMLFISADIPTYPHRFYRFVAP